MVFAFVGFKEPGVRESLGFFSELELFAANKLLEVPRGAFVPVPLTKFVEAFVPLEFEPKVELLEEPGTWAVVLAPTVAAFPMLLLLTGGLLLETRVF